jgi:hypothetical protein
MIKKFIAIFVMAFIIMPVYLSSQTLVASYNFPNYIQYNTFWGITQINDSLWIGTNNSPSYLFRVTKTGTITDSILTPFTYNHGLAWDGSGFWVAQDYTSSGAKIFKINRQGIRIDTIITGTSLQGIGGIALDGNNLWAASYYPDFIVYPFAWAYKINMSSKTVTDSIPLRGKQVQGIAVKGDTIFYVNSNFQGEAERIYAYRKVVGDTLFSFPAPDPDNDCDPRGLYWDGQFLWLMANRIGNNINQYRTLYKYSITGQGSPQISTSTSSVNFGNVIIGNTANQGLTITNSGTAKLIISAFNITNPVFGISPNAVPDTINPGNNKNYTLSFTPAVFDTTSGELRISSNDAGTPIKIVSLRGKGVYSGAYIGFSSTSNNYNNRRVNSLSGFTFNVTNQGTIPLQINSVNFSTQRFRIDSTNVNFPIIIDTQKTRTLRIWFNPNAVATFTDSAIFNTNAVNNSAAKILLSGTSQNNPTALGDIMWEGNVPSDPNGSFQDFQPISIKQISDVNGDGINDIILCTGNYWTMCLNGNSSVTMDTLWKFTTDFGSINTGTVTYKDALQLIDDINSDGVKDIIIGCGGGNEMVYALSGKNGRRIWAYGDSIATSDGDVNGIRVDRDYNNDGIKDVLISASGEGNGTGRHSVICLNGLNGQVIFNSVQNSEFTHDVISTENGGAIAYNSNNGVDGVFGFNNTGSNSWNYPVNGAIWSMKKVPDINNDGSTDILGMYGFNGGIFALSGINGNQLWTTSFGNSNNGTIELLDDRDRNGFLDFTLSGPQTAYRLDSKTDSIIWSQSFNSSYIRDADMLGDLNGDTINEVLYSTQQPGIVFVLDGAAGTTLFQYSFGTSINQRADRVCRLNSIDGNFSNEFVAGCRDGRIKCFSGGTNGVIGIQAVSGNIPKEFALRQNYPNPFNPSTQIKFDIPKQGNGRSVPVQLKIYDLLGREVEVLVNGNLSPGTYKMDWNANKYSSGIYFYELRAGTYRNVKKMILLK